MCFLFGERASLAVLVWHCIVESDANEPKGVGMNYVMAYLDPRKSLIGYADWQSTPDFIVSESSGLSAKR